MFDARDPGSGSPDPGSLFSPIELQYPQYPPSVKIQEDMFIAAIILSIIGFILLVLTLILKSHLWTVLLIIVVIAGIICFLMDEWAGRRENLRN